VRRPASGSTGKFFSLKNFSESGVAVNHVPGRPVGVGVWAKTYRIDALHNEDALVSTIGKMAISSPC
jgi:hypothetical protein